MPREGETRGAGEPKRQRTEAAHPRFGISERYGPCFRNQAIALTFAGQGSLVQCHPSSVNRWRRNGVVRQAKTGNKGPRVLRGEHQFLLCVIRRLRPKSTAAQVAAFICNNSSDHALFTDKQISKREIELGMTRKCAATTAEQAFTPQNILRAQLYWTTPWPTGIEGANYKNDSDEFGLWVEKANPSRGKAPRGIAVRQAGKYGHGDKFTCVISIMEDGRRWFSMEKRAGTSAEDFNDFIDDVVNGPAGIGPAGGAVPQVTFIWDNLVAHHSALVVNIVYSAFLDKPVGCVLLGVAVSGALHVFSIAPGASISIIFSREVDCDVAFPLNNYCFSLISLVVF